MQEKDTEVIQSFPSQATHLECGRRDSGTGDEAMAL